MNSTSQTFPRSYMLSHATYLTVPTVLVNFTFSLFTMLKPLNQAYVYTTYMLQSLFQKEIGA